MRALPFVLTSITVALFATAAGAQPSGEPTVIARSSQGKSPQAALGRPVSSRGAATLGHPLVMRGQSPEDETSKSSAFYTESMGIVPPKAPAADKAGEKATAKLAPTSATPVEPIIDPNCGPCMSGPRGNCAAWYGSAELLLWQLRDSHTPELITTSSVGTRNVPFIPGALGSPGTVVLFGGEIDHGWRPGLRGTVGYWFDPCQTLGVEGSLFGLEHRAVTYVAGSGGAPPVFRPFFNLSPIFVGEDVQDVAFPGELAGTVAASLDTRLWGAEVNLRKSLCYGQTSQCSTFNVDLLGGVRFLSLSETLQIDEYLTVLAQQDGGPVAGSTFILHDEFRTDNRFYGGQVGAKAEVRRGKMFVDVTGKLALGVTHQEASIDGFTQAMAPGGAPVFRRGGLLTQPTNIGERDRNVFSIVPEVGLNVGYQVTDNARVFGGWSLLYWTNVVRPGDQVDRVVNATQLPGSPVPFSGPARPRFEWNSTDFWAQGFNVGLEVRY